MTLPYITNKQKETITLLSRFRYINRIHIQTLMHHKDKKTINMWLKDLTEKEYIERIRGEGFLERNTPYVYNIGKNGIKYLMQEGYPLSFIRKLYDEKTRETSFVDRCLLIADMCCHLNTKNAEHISGETYSYVTQQDYQLSDSPFSFLTNQTPQLCITKTKGKMKSYFLLDIFDQTLPQYRVKKRIRSYVDFFLCNDWENAMGGPFPTILLVCPTTYSLIYSKRYAKRTLEEQQCSNLHIRFATAADAQTENITAEIWEETEAKI